MVKWSKAKRIDKSKVKLKAKQLPKGQNVTNTSFKTKRIILPSQLKGPNENEIYTKKKLNVQELLSHLKHHNMGMRREGVSGLKELMSVCEDDIIKLHLPKVIDNVSGLVLDIENSVRKDALKLLEMILTKVSSEQIEPHFKIMKTYLSCAMTHINISVREDSLLLLDCLLNACPLLMVKKADDILPTFLNMISNMKNDQNRTLSLIVHKQVTNVQWRMKVFQRMTKYFSIIVHVKILGNKGPEPMEIDSSSPENSLKNVAWNENSPLFAAEFISFKKEICNLPRVFSNIQLSATKIGASTIEQEKIFQETVGSLLPILFEAWVEVAPLQNSPEVNILTEEAAVILLYVVETLKHIWDCFENWEEEFSVRNLTPWFIKYYQKPILSAFLPGFPFSVRENLSKFRGKAFPILKEEESLFKNTKSISLKCTQQNLILCCLFACISDKNDKATVAVVMNYLQSCVLDWENMELLPILKKVIVAFLFEERNSWAREQLLEAAVEKCTSPNTPNELKSALFSVLCDFIVLPECHENFGHNSFKTWMFELSCVVFQSEVTSKSLKALTSLANQNQKYFMDGLKKRSKSIANFFCTIPLTGFSSPFEGQKAIVNLLFHAASPQVFSSLVRILSFSEEHKELLSYIRDLQELRQFLEL